MDSEPLPFAGRVAEGLSRSGLTLRGLCREAGLDPSFFSKILSGKRSPPAEEAVLRRIAGLLGLDAAELIVSAGRIPSEWRGLWSDRRLFEEIHSRLSRGSGVFLPPGGFRSPGGFRAAKTPAPQGAAPFRAVRQKAVIRRETLSEELL